MQWRLSYGEWVLYGFNGFQLVHSMCLEKRDILPLGLSHNGCVLFVIWGFSLWLCMGGRLWRRPPDCEVYLHWVYTTAHWFGLMFHCGHTSHPLFGLCLASAERDWGAACIYFCGLQTFALVAIVILWVSFYLLPFNPLGHTVDRFFLGWGFMLWVSMWGLHFSFGHMITHLGFLTMLKWLCPWSEFALPLVLSINFGL